MLHPIVSRIFGKTVSFSHSKLSILSIIYGSDKTFRVTLEFINVHLQQQGQVASKLRIVDFWLIVCGDSRVLTVATK